MEAIAPRADEERDFLDSVSCGLWVWLLSTPKLPIPGPSTKGFPNKHCLLISPEKRLDGLGVFIKIHQLSYSVKFQAVKNTVTYWAATI